MHLEDYKIIDLFLERSEQAITELDRKYGAAVKKMAANILRNRQDTEEIADDTYLGVWNTIPPQKPDPLVSYVCRIARNLALNRYYANHAAKRNGNYDLVLDELEECIPSGINLETEYEAKELSEAINRFLATLPGEDRILFVRRYWYACPVSELAAMTGSSPNLISVRLFRIRGKLKKQLTREGFLP